MAKILIVDDEKDVAGLFKDVLQKGGYEVTVTHSGKACLAAIRKDKFDLVLMDMFMPGMSGRETFEHILHDEKLSKTKVAFLTVADLGEKGKAELGYLGCLGYLTKPIKNDVLLAEVKKLLDIKKK